ncbi:MAG: NAD(P)/FAD-dependent oxidoreductase [Deltaproteobacteria bacterium]|nr:MAG: NAD(P)/FAD-dependent oxidoreductase [Deltaproteobacteria bacterium]
MSPETDVVVIGAGVVGLACAAALARDGRSVVTVERNAALAQETTARSSEVVHAGIYYPPGSLKAALCVAGREALYARCERLGISHRRTGKLIVATREDEVAELESLRARGTDNGAPGLELIDADAVRRREPCVRARAALFSPASGIVDAHALCLSYAAEAEAAGALFAYRRRVVAIEFGGGGFAVRARSPEDALESLTCTAVVNAGGLESDRLAALAGIDVDGRGYRLHLCKGDYFSLAPGAPVRVAGLVYPVPSGPGLGIHATVDLAGRVRFGPDAEYVDRVRYDVDPAKAPRFAAAVQRYLPELDARWLAPDFAGVRPRLATPQERFRDFVIAEESAAGLPGLVNLIGIESPGLTAAPAIAERVVQLLRAR